MGMNQGNWIDAGDAAACLEGQGIETIVDENIVAIFRVDGRLFAMSGICPHHGGPLGKGRLQGCVVTCPWHGWQFDVRDGTYRSSQQLRHPTYAVREEAGRIWVCLDSPPSTSVE